MNTQHLLQNVHIPLLLMTFVWPSACTDVAVTKGGNNLRGTGEDDELKMPDAATVSENTWDGGAVVGMDSGWTDQPRDGGSVAEEIDISDSNGASNPDLAMTDGGVADCCDGDVVDSEACDGEGCDAGSGNGTGLELYDGSSPGDPDSGNTETAVEPFDCSDPVVFPDPRFERAVRMALGEPLGTLSSETLLNISVLDTNHLSGPRTIERLDGIQCLKNLEELDLSNEKIRSLDPLRGLAKLRKVNFERNLIDDAEPLSGALTLEQINLVRNNLVSISPLRNLPNLTEIFVDDNPVTEIPNFGFAELALLSLSWAPIVDISPAWSYPELTELIADNTYVETPAPPNVSTSLEIIHVDNHSGDRDRIPIDNLGWLIAAPNLKELRIGGAALTSLDGVQDAVELETLTYNAGRPCCAGDIGYGALTDLSPLSDLKKLRFLGITNNPNLVDIAPLSGLTNLEILYLDLNHIRDLSALANLTSLREFYAYGNVTLDSIEALESLPLDSVNVAGTFVRDFTPLARNANFVSGDLLVISSDVECSFDCSCPGLRELAGRGVRVEDGNGRSVLDCP